MANYKAMTAFKKALAAPEDLFDVGTVFREVTGRIVVKVAEGLWLEVTAAPDGTADTATVSIADVVEAVGANPDAWQVSHGWKLAPT